MKDEPLWYQNAIFYQLHVKCFCDSNQDGIGDFRGLKSKLEYIQDLGCTAIWLQPFYPSPLKTTAMTSQTISASIPTTARLPILRVFSKRRIREILKLSQSLSSTTLPISIMVSKGAPIASRNSVFHNYYMWSDTPDKYPDARIIFRDFETSNWAWDPVAKSYYWHRFYSHQPDLNYDNPQV